MSVGGPNDGYWYVTRQAYKVDRRWKLNERLDPNGPEELPDSLHGDTVNLWTYMERRHSRKWKDWMHPRDFRAAVIRHERYGDATLKGHQGQIEKAIAWKTCGDGAILADKLVAAGQDWAEKALFQIESVANLAYYKASGHHNVHSHFRTYVPTWLPGDTIPGHELFGDTPETDSIPIVDECDWNNF